MLTLCSLCLACLNTASFFSHTTILAFIADRDSEVNRSASCFLPGGAGLQSSLLCSYDRTDELYKM